MHQIRPTHSGSHMPIKPSLIFLFYGRESMPFWKPDSTNGFKTKPVLPELLSFRENRRPPLNKPGTPSCQLYADRALLISLDRRAPQLFVSCLFLQLFTLPIEIWLALEPWAQWCYSSSHHSDVRVLYSKDPGLRSNYFLKDLSKRIHKIILTSYVLKKGFQKQKIICGALKLFNFCISVGRCMPPPPPIKILQNTFEYSCWFTKLC